MILHIMQNHIILRLNIFFLENITKYYTDCIATAFSTKCFEERFDVFIFSLMQYAITYKFLTARTWEKQFLINSKLKFLTLLKLCGKWLENLRHEIFVTWYNFQMNDLS